MRHSSVFGVVWLIALLFASASYADKPIRIVLIGDSTVASYPNPPKDRPDLTGWGQVLGEFFIDRVVVVNLAVSGESSKSHLREGRWQKALAAKGDYLFIQFGHNDCPGKGDRTTDPNTDYQDNLRLYIDQARAVGTKPVLVTSVSRRTFGSNGTITTTLQPYADAMHKVGKENGVPVIDLHALSMAMFNRLGDEGSADLSVAPADRSHFSRKGARAVAQLLVDALPTAVPELKACLKTVSEHKSYLVVPPTAGPSGKVSLSVEEPAGVDRRQWPVSSGIPFAEGILRNDQSTLLEDATGRELPLQTETLVRWPDGSIRWLLLDFQIDLAAKEKKLLTLSYGPTVRRAAVDKPVVVTKEKDGKVTISPGPVRMEYDPKCFAPQGKVHLVGNTSDPGDDEQVTFNCGWDGIQFRGEPDERYSPRQGTTKIVVEQFGPVRVSLRASGQYGTRSGNTFSYIARIHAWRGQPYTRVFFTLVNDRQDAVMAKFRSLAIAFWCHGGLDYLDGKTVDKESRLFQVDEDHCLLNDRPAGKRGCGWAAVGSESGGIAVGLRHFWQNWPKGIRIAAFGPGTCIYSELFPELPKGLYDNKPLEEENKLYYALRGGMYTLKVGAAKTHEFWINYLSGKPDAKKLGAFFQATEEPLMALADPAYACGTKAMGEFPAGDPKKYAGYDTWLDKIMDTHLKQRDQEREYGVLNWGDWFGERKVNWGNLEYDMAHGMLVQYLRTGDRRYFLRGEQASRHHVDMDVIHATNPLLKNPWGPPPEVGQMWVHCLNHTGGYYENAPLPVERTYQMGYSQNFGHVWVGGDFEYYCLTGDRRVREVAVQMADAMARHCPTTYGTHIRNLGWPIVLLLSAYDATGDKKYLDAATSCWQVLKKHFDPKRGWVVRLARDHCLHPERTCCGNVPFMEGLTISGLTRYHRITRDPEVLQAVSVGIDQMIRECWVEEDKAFRYTACPLSRRKTPYICLAAEGMAYEGRLTGNREHLRILREGLREAMLLSASGGGKGFAQMIHFMPYALPVLEESPTGK